MKKEHFDYVYNHFKEQLDLYNEANVEYYMWFENVHVSDLCVVDVKYSEGRCISSGNGPSIFVEIPTKEEAKDILQYIKDTEVFFV